VDQRYGDTDTMTQPQNQSQPDTSTQRYEEARAAARRAMTTVSLIPDKPLPQTIADEPPISYRGFKFGAAFYGWLITNSMAVLLVFVAAGATVGVTYLLDYTRADAEQQPGTVAIAAAAVLGLLVCCAFYSGGYVAGRLARFDGVRQGFGVWMIALLLAVIAGGAGALLNNQYDLVAEVDRPDVPLADNVLANGAIISAAAVIVLTLVAALLGGKAGQRYHNKIDELLS
jgi:H+/Cl- antiporter ClcA